MNAEYLRKGNSEFIMNNREKIISWLSNIQEISIPEDIIRDYFLCKKVCINREEACFIERINDCLMFINLHSTFMDINEACLTELHTKLVGASNPLRGIKSTVVKGAVSNLNFNKDDCKARIRIMDKILREYLVFAEENDLLRILGAFLIVAKYPNESIKLDRNSLQVVRSGGSLVNILG